MRLNGTELYLMRRKSKMIVRTVLTLIRHVIKNRNSATSQACQALMGKYRWALSGTPILNTPDELFPYFKFLEVDGTTDFKQFHGNLSKLALRARNGYIKKTLGEIMK